MTHLTKLHLVIAAGDKVVTRLPSVRIMAGNAGELTASAPLRRIRLACYRMTAAIAECYGMNPFANLLMTGEAECIDRLVQLARVFTGMGVMAGFAHTGSNRPMEKLERF